MRRDYRSFGCFILALGSIWSSEAAAESFAQYPDHGLMVQLGGQLTSHDGSFFAPATQDVLGFTVTTLDSEPILGSWTQVDTTQFGLPADHQLVSFEPETPMETGEYVVNGQLPLFVDPSNASVGVGELSFGPNGLLGDGLSCCDPVEGEWLCFPSYGASGFSGSILASGAVSSLLEVVKRPGRLEAFRRGYRFDETEASGEYCLQLQLIDVRGVALVDETRCGVSPFHPHRVNTEIPCRANTRCVQSLDSQYSTDESPRCQETMEPRLDAGERPILAVDLGLSDLRQAGDMDGRITGGEGCSLALGRPGTHPFLAALMLLIVGFARPRKE